MVNRVALGEVCDFIRGVAFDGNEAIDLPKEGYVPILRAGNIGDELYIREDLVWVPEKRVSQEQYFQVGDIAICMASGSPAVLGKTAQLKESFIGSVGAFCGIIRPTKADPNYISYWLKSPTFMAWRDSQANGVNIQNLRPNEVREIEIPLPPLEEQKRIASLLARADRLRGLRRAAREQFDSLLQSVFLEMFGDVVKNEKGFDVFPFEELSTRITKGESPNWQGFSYENNGVSFITSENVLWGKLDISNPKYISEKFHTKLKRSQLTENDLLINLVGASIGRATLVTSDALPANINQAVATISMDTAKLNPYFVLYQILNPYKQNQLLGNIVESARANISLTNISELNLIVPPLALQEEFARVVARVEALRARMDESARQGEALFQSLLAESFG